jgi:hypothetical protein
LPNSAQYHFIDEKLPLIFQPAWSLKESDYAIWTFSRFSYTALDSLGWRIRIFSRRRVHDSPAADFCRDLVDRPLVYQQR